MKSLKKYSLISALLLLASVSHAAESFDTASLYSKDQLQQSFSACLSLFPKNDDSLVRSSLTNLNPTALCSNGFAVWYSKQTKTPLVVIEKLNKSIIADTGEDRTDKFFPDPRLKRADRADLNDYKGSGFDRGHMSPAGNAVDPTAMAQTFALSNMVPQDQTNNRKVWSKLESDTRKYASRAKGNVFVFTGPIFDSTSTIFKIGKNQVWVPTHLFKVVYDETSNQAWAWILPNSAQAVLGKPMPYKDFQNITGLKFLNLN